MLLHTDKPPPNKQLPTNFLQNPASPTPLDDPGFLIFEDKENADPFAGSGPDIPGSHRRQPLTEVPAFFFKQTCPLVGQPRGYRFPY
jgi:hypothetical protein